MSPRQFISKKKQKTHKASAVNIGQEKDCWKCVCMCVWSHSRAVRHWYKALLDKLPRAESPPCTHPGQCAAHWTEE